MAAKLPPARYQIVERDGRLVVLDAETGHVPPTAAQRMAVHDTAHGDAALRSDRADEQRTQMAAAPGEPKPPPGTGPHPPAKAKATPWKPKVSAAPVDMASSKPQPPALAVAPPPSRGTLPGRAKPLVTAKWWDAKGPRSIVLTPTGAAKLRGTFTNAAVIAVVILIAVLIIMPIFAVIAMVLFSRWGRDMVARFGANAIDAALRER